MTQTLSKYRTRAGNYAACQNGCPSPAWAQLNKMLEEGRCCPLWETSFQSFGEWYYKHPDFGKGMILDCVVGSSNVGLVKPMYSPETCNFLTAGMAKWVETSHTWSHNGLRGILPLPNRTEFERLIGRGAEDNEMEYITRIWLDSEQEYKLVRFDCPFEASIEYETSHLNDGLLVAMSMPHLRAFKDYVQRQFHTQVTEIDRRHAAFKNGSEIWI